jgi:hypothetical protein
VAPRVGFLLCFGIHLDVNCHFIGRRSHEH